MADEIEVPASIAAPSNGVPASQEHPAGLQERSVGQTSPEANDWRIPGVEKFKSPAELAKAYLESQGTMSKSMGRTKELETFFAQHIAPYWDDYASWKQEQLAQRGRRGRKAKDEDGEGDDAPEVNAEFEALKEQMSAVQRNSMMMASANGTRDFYRDNPEAKKYDEQIAEVIASGTVNTTDPFNPDAFYASAEAAWKIVKSGLDEKQTRARKASAVEGQGLEPGETDEQDLWDLPLNKLKDRAYGTNIVVR